MKLNEKIRYYRTRVKLSQEELAARVGVSRQAVSKWELDEATPDVAKLVLLAKTLGVTTDELLSEEEPREEHTKEEQAAPSQEESGTPSPDDWLNSATGRLGKLIRRYGWLAGVYLAVSGAVIALFGALGRFMFQKSFAMTSSWFEPAVSYSGPPELTGAIWFQSDFPARETDSILLMIPTGILVVGIIITIVGVVLAVVLYRRGKR